MRLRKIKPSSIFQRKHRRKLSLKCCPCKCPKTLSFQDKNNNQHRFTHWWPGSTPVAGFSRTPENGNQDGKNYSGASPRSDCGEELLSNAGQALESNRLSFEPDESSSILAASSKFPFDECMVLAMESDDPYMDFASSMDQMIKAGYGLKSDGVSTDWGSMEELLTWYLMMNSRKNQDFIVAAFVDLCINMSAVSTSSSLSALSNL